MERLLVTPAEAAALLGIGRSKLYELLRSEVIRSVRIGGCRRIPRSALVAFVAGLSVEDVASVRGEAASIT